MPDFTQRMPQQKLILSPEVLCLLLVTSSLDVEQIITTLAAVGVEFTYDTVTLPAAR